MSDTPKLTHVDESGAARMVDVSAKDESARVAVAEGEIRLRADVADALFGNALSKGDALAVARIAGIMAAKRPPDLIPLCHPIATTGVEIEIARVDEPCGARVRASVKTVGRTGAEMEALTAVSVALLTIYDMTKALQKDAVIERVRLRRKSGGKSGDLALE